MPKTRPRSSNPPRPLNLNPRREEKHSKTGSEGYRGNEFIGCTLISLFKYHWWRSSRVSNIPIALPPRNTFSSSSSSSSSRQEGCFFLRVESKVPRPNISPGHFLYFPVFLPRRLLPGKLQRGTRDTGLGGFISPRVSPFLPTFTGTRADFSIRSKDRKEGREGEARDEFEWERDRERAEFLGSSRIFFLFFLCEFLSYRVSLLSE